MMKSVVLKRLPCGGYIKLPVDFSGIELLAELCSLDREKLDGFLEKQVIPNPRGPRDILKEATKMMRKETSSSSKNNPPSPDSVLFLETIMSPPAKKQKKEQKNSKTESWNYQSLLPAEFKNKIVELAGSDGVVCEEKLLIQKRLTKTDLDKGQSRLSIPSKQMREAKFLTDGEERLLAYHDGKNVGSLDNVTIIEPSLQTSQASLRSWDIGSSVCYIITKNWNEIKDRNELKQGMTLQVWAIRVRGELCLALVKLPD